jgi:hypothetical protein
MTSYLKSTKAKRAGGMAPLWSTFMASTDTEFKPSTTKKKKKSRESQATWLKERIPHGFQGASGRISTCD